MPACDNESALLWLEKACEARDAFLPMLVKVDPRMHLLHGDARYHIAMSAPDPKPDVG